MHETIASLAPPSLWHNFVALNAVPRPSKQEGRVIAFMEQFAHSLGLPIEKDSTGNLVIRKPASPGREDRPVVALQAHLDMVCQKNTGSDFDFSQEGIRMILEGDWVRADGTTLGADNGIGVAAIMAVLAAKDLAHPPLEALFTVDEETGMTGAQGLQPGVLRAQVLLNLDTEDEDELTIGCAGGVDIVGEGAYTPESADLPLLEIRISGLSGGHSGMDIHLGRANANKLMNRLLLQASRRFPLRLSSLDGGGLRNAIPRESRARVGLPSHFLADFQAWMQEFSQTVAAELATTDRDFCLRWEAISGQAQFLGANFQGRFLRALYALPCGIYRLSPEVEGLVQTSNNLARVQVENGKFTVACLGRGSLDSEKMDLAQAVASALELAGATVEFLGAYPGWTPRPTSSLVQIMSELYRRKFHADPKVKACHAGLECGILGQNYPNLEMISLGPNIRGAHSPDERVQVSSVERFWGYLVLVLESL